MEKDFRPHPVEIILGAKRYLLLLALPLARSFLYARRDPSLWLRGAWIDILAVCAVLLLGLIRWYFTKITVGPRRVFCRRGLFWRRNEACFAPEKTILRVSRPFFLRLTGAARVRFVFGCGYFENKPLTVGREDAARIAHVFSGAKAPIHSGARESGRVLRTALTGAASSSLAGGISAVSALLGTTAQIFGESAPGMFWRTAYGVAEKLSFGLPTVYLTVGATIAFVYLAAFFHSFLTLWGLHSLRDGTAEQNIRVYSGLFSKYYHVVPEACAGSFELRSRLLPGLSRGFWLTLCAPGLCRRGERLLLSPQLPAGKARRDLEKKLPGTPLPLPLARTNIRACAPAFLLIPVIFFLISLGLVFAAPALWREYGEFFRLWGIILSVLSLKRVGDRVYFLYRTGLGGDGKTLCAAYGSGGIFRRVYIPAEKVIFADIRRSPAARRAGLCTVYLREQGNGGGPGSPGKGSPHKVRGIPFFAAAEILRRAGVWRGD